MDYATKPSGDRHRSTKVQALGKGRNASLVDASQHPRSRRPSPECASIQLRDGERRGRLRARSASVLVGALPRPREEQTHARAGPSHERDDMHACATRPRTLWRRASRRRAAVILKRRRRRSSVRGEGNGWPLARATEDRFQRVEECRLPRDPSRALDNDGDGRPHPATQTIASGLLVPHAKVHAKGNECAAALGGFAHRSQCGPGRGDISTSCRMPSMMVFRRPVRREERDVSIDVRTVAGLFRRHHLLPRRRPFQPLLRLRRSRVCAHNEGVYCGPRRQKNAKSQTATHCVGISLWPLATGAPGESAPKTCSGPRDWDCPDGGDRPGRQFTINASALSVLRDTAVNASLRELSASAIVIFRSRSARR